jgi:hypothetical protein
LEDWEADGGRASSIINVDVSLGLVSVVRLAEVGAENE